MLTCFVAIDFSSNRNRQTHANRFVFFLGYIYHISLLVSCYILSLQYMTRTMHPKEEYTFVLQLRYMLVVKVILGHPALATALHNKGSSSFFTFQIEGLSASQTTYAKRADKTLLHLYEHCCKSGGHLTGSESRKCTHTSRLRLD